MKGIENRMSKINAYIKRENAILEKDPIKKLKTDFIILNTKDLSIFPYLEAIKEKDGEDAYNKLLDKAVILLVNNLKNREYSFKDKIEFISKFDIKYDQILLQKKELLDNDEYSKEVNKTFEELMKIQIQQLVSKKIIPQEYLSQESYLQEAAQTPKIEEDLQNQIVNVYDRFNTDIFKLRVKNLKIKAGESLLTKENIQNEMSEKIKDFKHDIAKIEVNNLELENDLF